LFMLIACSEFFIGAGSSVDGTSDISLSCVWKRF
jgi:hypothetical protein